MRRGIRGIARVTKFNRFFKMLNPFDYMPIFPPVSAYFTDFSAWVTSASALPLFAMVHGFLRMFDGVLDIT